eukprot:6214323-Pleurochrysis_carterae.AAC.1
MIKYDFALLVMIANVTAKHQFMYIILDATLRRQPSFPKQFVHLPLAAYAISVQTCELGFSRTADIDLILRSQDARRPPSSNKGKSICWEASCASAYWLVLFCHEQTHALSFLMPLVHLHGTQRLRALGGGEEGMKRDLEGRKDFTNTYLGREGRETERASEREEKGESEPASNRGGSGEGKGENEKEAGKGREWREGGGDGEARERD